jgi:hypothetical protein
MRRRYSRQIGPARPPVVLEHGSFVSLLVSRISVCFRSSEMAGLAVSLLRTR